MSYQSVTTNASSAQSLPLLKRWMMKPLAKLNENLARWLLTQPTRLKPMDLLEPLAKKPSEELPQASKYRPAPKSENSHTDLLVSAFLVAVAHKNSGQVMNLDLIACVSSREEHPAKVAAMLATLSTQPFVRFSLN